MIYLRDNITTKEITCPSWTESPSRYFYTNYKREKKLLLLNKGEKQEAKKKKVITFSWI